MVCEQSLPPDHPLTLLWMGLRGRKMSKGCKDGESEVEFSPVEVVLKGSRGKIIYSGDPSEVPINSQELGATSDGFLPLKKVYREVMCS